MDVFDRLRKFAWIIGLLTVRDYESRSIAYIKENIFIMDVLDVNWNKQVPNFLKMSCVKLLIVISYICRLV